MDQCPPARFRPLLRRHRPRSKAPSRSASGLAGHGCDEVPLDTGGHTRRAHRTRGALIPPCSQHARDRLPRAWGYPACEPKSRPAIGPDPAVVRVRDGQLNPVRVGIGPLPRPNAEGGSEDALRSCRGGAENPTTSGDGTALVEPPEHPWGGHAVERGAGGDAGHGSGPEDQA